MWLNYNRSIVFQIKSPKNLVNNCFHLFLFGGQCAVSPLTKAHRLR